jgi:acyl carrier protein
MTISTDEKQTQSEADLRSRIRDFVVGNFYIPSPKELDDTSSLVEAGVVDSTGVMEIIAFLASSVGVTVEDDEIVPENLDSIERITRYVARKMA